MPINDPIFAHINAAKVSIALEALTIRRRRIITKSKYLPSDLPCMLRLQISKAIENGFKTVKLGHIFAKRFISAVNSLAPTKDEA